MSIIGAPAQDGRAARPPGDKPHTAGYLVAGLLAVAGIVGGLVWTFAAGAAMTGYTDRFARSSVPGRLTLHVSHPGLYYVYAEGTRWAPVVRVTGPAGRAIPVTATSPGPTYFRGGSSANAVGKFHATLPGDYRVTAATGSAVQGEFAVGGSTANWWRPHEWGAAALLMLSVSSGIALAVVTAIGRRRRVTGPRLAYAVAAGAAVAVLLLIAFHYLVFP